jgi:hypothetical protein
MAHERTGSTPRELDVFRHPIRPENVASIVALSGAERAKFDIYFKKAPNFILKYRTARSLIEDGKFKDPVTLFTGFVPDERAVPEEQKPLVQDLEQRLHFLMIQKGHLAPSTLDPRVAERLMADEIQQKENYRDLFEAGWPIEVLGQMMTVDNAADLSDEQKMEELRAWTTNAMLREYMGLLTGKRQKRDLTITDIRDRIPDRVFANPEQIKSFLIEHHIEQRLQKSITEAGLTAGLAAVQLLADETPPGAKKDFFQNLSYRFYDIATEPLDGDFNSTIMLKGQPKTIPSFEQRSFVYDFMHNGTRLIAAETGLGKTITFYLSMEQTDAEKVLVIAPAAGKKTWEIEHKKFFRDSDGVFTINNLEDMAKAKESNKKYIVIGQEFLSDAEFRPEIEVEVMKMLEECKVDGGGVDEIGNLSNPKAVSTQMIVKIADKIRQNYTEKHPGEEKTAPIVGLTATPIKTGLKDMNVMMGLLYPDRYAISQNESAADKRTFSDTHLNKPTNAFCSLVGEKLMFRWENAAGVQEFSYSIDEIEASPFEDYLYSFIENHVGTNSLNKIRILEDSLFNPLLVKAEVRHLARKNLPQFDLDQVIGLLTNAVSQWKAKKGIDSPKTEHDYLSSDKLVELGMGDVVLSCFFSDLLENGIDTIVDEMTKGATEAELKELRKFWKPRDISTKYSRLKQMIDEALTWRELPDGTIGREKVFLVSPERVQGRTGKLLQRDIKDEDGTDRPLYATYELESINESILLPHLRSWLEPHMDPERLPIVDGSMTLGRMRDGQIESYTDDPDVAMIFANLPAAYQSRDYTLNVVEDSQGRKIIGVRKILLAPPWYFEKLKQMGGRSQRQGQLVPMDMQMMHTKGMIEQGKSEAVLYTYLISRMAFSGLRPTPEQQDFLDSKRIGDRVPLRSADSTYLRDVFDWIRGVGEDTLDDYLGKDSGVVEGMTHERLMAERFYDGGNDAYHTSGYNAELVAQVLKKLTSSAEKIATIGAGTMLLQRKLKAGIDNIDINPHMMDAAWDEASQYGGRKIVGRASSLSETEFPSGSYKAVTNDFALHWSKLELTSPEVSSSERVKILQQMHRILENPQEDKSGGLMIITLPEKNFDEESFERFCSVLENHFGVTIEKQFSGQTYGRSRLGTNKRLGWSIVAKKTGDLRLDGLKIDDLRFANESEEWQSTVKKKKSKPKGTPKQYPTPQLKLEFDQYEIVQTNNEKTVLSYDNAPLPESIPVVVPQVPANGSINFQDSKTTEPTKEYDFIRGNNQKEYRDYRTSLLKPVLKIMKKTMKDVDLVEKELTEIFEKLQQSGRIIDTKVTAYTLILREVRKMYNQHGRR